jgi:hypothetical protein
MIHWIGLNPSAIVWSMRGVVHRSLIWSLALLFFSSGFAAHYCVEAHQSTGHAGIVHPGENGYAHQALAGEQLSHSAHDHGAVGHQHASDDDSTSDVDDVACAKCCGTCTLATATMPEVVDQVIFTVTPAVFASRSDRCAGSTVRVDPGIPKRII